MSSQIDPWSRCSDADREVIELLQGEVRPVPDDEIEQRLRGHYRHSGDRVAVIDGTRSWTYAELGERVFGLAHCLAVNFPPPGMLEEQVFGVAVDRSPELIMAVHAVALTGAAYCPISPADPAPWQSSVVGTSGAAAVLAVDDTSQDIFPHSFAISSEACVKPDFEPATGGMCLAAQVIFTSGSTGRPKGVICSRAGFANRLRWMQETFPLGPRDRVALKTPVTFDVAGWEMFWPQYAGAATVIVPPGEHASPEALISLFNEHQVTVAHFVPSMLRMWLRAEGARRCPSLRMVFSSGEALDSALVEEFSRQSAAELHNLYGPTEAAIDVTHYPASAAPRQPVPIGRPITNTRLYVLDGDGFVCPIGEPGEIHIQGAGVAVGYLGADEEEAARFNLIHLDAPEGWRTFRTGDLGRYTPDGQIEYCGRADDQLKIRGQRVEPGEIIQALRDHERVLDAYVKAHASGSGRTVLVAYVVVDNQHEMGNPVSALHEHLTRLLPARSIPSKFVLLDSMPLSRHGKVDVHRLDPPGRARPALEVAFQEPRGPIEELIANTWAHVLDLDEVGVHDDFHDLGGDSLSAVEITFVLTELLGLEYGDAIVPRILMDGDTVARSAEIAEEAGVRL
ncbi:amino acid adenylation domain-containing protein [Kitasatospora sp. MAA19]|uniref:non-ribosomal peptide synthetase n=1 Tax=Kitasatospora sp. MAA19 TaxID=3035090 RepID=UPI00247600AD|nr:non-ribosomal peptide synthetase [Kitasatospora sp. MAA19]MDH6709071.1 amino acid adenylation domain-containing protein [Kitasatospora sp. MAA19]